MNTKVLFLIGILITFHSYAQTWRHVVPSESELTGNSLQEGELFTSGEYLRLITNEPEAATIKFTKTRNTVPVIAVHEKYTAGAKRKVVSLSKGEILFNGSVLENTNDVFCRHDANGGLPGGYDNADPFATQTIAYIYIVRDGDGYNCVLSTSATGLINTTVNDESILAGAIFIDLVYQYQAFHITERNEATTALYFSTSGIQKVATCQAITITNYPANTEYGSFALFTGISGFTSLALYDNSSCATKVLDFDLRNTTQFDGEIPSGYVKNKIFYVKGVISGTASTTVQQLTLSTKKLKFKIKYFNQGT